MRGNSRLLAKQGPDSSCVPKTLGVMGGGKRGLWVDLNIGALNWRSVVAEDFFAAWDNEAAIDRARDHPAPTPQVRVTVAKVDPEGYKRVIYYIAGPFLCKMIPFQALTRVKQSSE